MLLITFLISKNLFIKMFNDTFLLTFVLMIPYMMLHELLHSLAYVIHGVKFKNITYGIHLEKGVLCCLCKQNIKRRNILISLIYPFIFIGVITYIIGMITNNSVLTLLSIINISGCSGDLIMFYDLLKLNRYEYSEFDDPTSFGLYTSVDLSKTKLLGLKYVGTKEDLEIKDKRKIVISKASVITLIFIVLLIIISLVLN